MDDREQIKQLYRRMYDAMIAKDISALGELHADEFVLTHMTGMRQPKAIYLESIADGTLNYYEATHDSIDIMVRGESATLIGRSRVRAAVFGGGQHTWPLQLDMKLEKRGGTWLFTAAKASTYR